MPYVFPWPVTVVLSFLAVALLYVFHRLPYAPTREEALQDALEHERSTSPAGPPGLAVHGEREA